MVATQVNSAEVMANTIRYFGQITGARIYANAVIVFDAKADKLENIEHAVRYIVGALKAIRTSANEAGKHVTYAEAIDQYEERNSVGGRKANIDAAFAVYDMEHHDAGRIANRVAMAAVAAQEAQDEQPETSLAVKLWVEDFKATLTKARAVRLASIMQTYRRGDVVERRDTQYVSNWLAPKGIGAEDFLEVLCKYTA